VVLTRQGEAGLPFARHKREAEKALLAAGFPRVYLFRPAYICPVQARKEPNFSYRLIRAVYPLFRLLFPQQIVRADDLAWASVDVVLRETQEQQGLVLENRDIRAVVKSQPPTRDSRRVNEAMNEESCDYRCRFCRSRRR
jgi:uncharacterized protein YbjT (DUF2867 family)